MATPAPTSPNRQRLPVNPRRNKVPVEARKRVVKACDSCNVRRARCSGGHPCIRCANASRECRYSAAEPTVTITKSEYDALLKKGALLDQTMTDKRSQATSSPASVLELKYVDRASTSGSQATSDKGIVDLSGRILQDQDGAMRYLGASSGSAFLTDLRAYMATVVIGLNATTPGLMSTESDFISALGKYQTHDSRPLAATTGDPMTLPTSNEALKMLSEFRYWIQDGAATVESGGTYFFRSIDQLVQEYEDHLENPSLEFDALSMASINAAFAVACQIDPSCGPEWDVNGQTFFARAKDLVGNPLETSSIGDATVLALMGFYLLNSNRRDAAYMYLSIAMHITLVHGVHQAWQVEEDGKRLFWNLYCIDRWLAMLVGRPVMIEDPYIKLDMPREAKGLPSPRGLCAKIELSRISHFIGAHIYDSTGAKFGNMRGRMGEALDRLALWQTNLPDILQYTGTSFSQDRAVYELRMHHNQLVIIAVRPLLFSSVKNMTAQLVLNGGRDEAQNGNVDHLTAAIEAACENIHLARQLLELRPGSVLSHAHIHYLFNSALVLELMRIVSPESYIHGEALVATVATTLQQDKDCNYVFSHDCAKVLGDISLIVSGLAEARARLQQKKPTATWSDPRLGIEHIIATDDSEPDDESNSPHSPHTTVASGSSRRQRPAQRRGVAYAELRSWLEESSSLNHQHQLSAG